ncbi:hypothetical protein KA405_02555 [Patescibacteria group bacterium]|nr:hypothetical protein [Patescibacteria group bacterium]
MIPLVLPPIIHAKAKIPFSSQITISSSVSKWTQSNKSVNCSPLVACLTVIVHSTQSPSKQCIGCPVRYIKYVQKSIQLFFVPIHKSTICKR